MDSRTGEVREINSLLAKLGPDDFRSFGVPIEESKLTTRAQNELRATGQTKVGRNDPCPCGSGRKFKRCHRA